MTQELYRKEAVAHRHRSLYGEIVLRAGPKTWLITVLLLCVFTLFIAGLFFLTLSTEDGPLRLYEWLSHQVRS